MTNLDKKEWEFSRGERYAVEFLEDKGFAVTIRQRYISKDYLTIERGGISYDVEIPLGDPDINYAKYMPHIVENFEMRRQLLELSDKEDTE